LGWSWGALQYLPFLPRVSLGRVVLARAQWLIKAEELKPMLLVEGAERFRRTQQWRHDRALPRYSLLVDDDNELLIDLDNTLSIESFYDLVKKRPMFVLAENFPGENALPVQGPEGQFTNELVVPLLRVRSQNRLAANRALQKGPVRGIRESFAPGSDWLYYRLYGGRGTADRVLANAVAPAVAELKARGVIDTWFFIRYGDPNPHLRVRLHGAAERLNAEALPEMYRQLNPLLEDGLLWRIELGTYLRETVRYGGPQTIILAEKLFEFDSDATIEILGLCAGDQGATWRWQLALASVDAYLRDFGMDLGRCGAFARSARDDYAREMHTAGKETQAWVSERFRRERAGLEILIDQNMAPDSGPLRAGIDVLARRSVAGAKIIAHIGASHAEGTLWGTPETLVHSLIHMSVNRLLRSSQRTQEFVIYEFLARLYGSALARAASTPNQKV
jgi:thiopeptide-type bacteriocin biosynthesis protein